MAIFCHKTWNYLTLQNLCIYKFNKNREQKNHTHLQVHDISFNRELLTFALNKKLFLMGESGRNFRLLSPGDRVHLLVVV